MRSLMAVLPAGMAQDGGAAARGEDQAQQQLDRGAFARAVGPEQAEDFAAVDGEIEVVQGADFVPAPEILVDLGQMFGMNRFVVGCDHDIERSRPLAWPGWRCHADKRYAPSYHRSCMINGSYRRVAPIGGLRVVRACRRRFSLGFS